MGKERDCHGPYKDRKRNFMGQKCKSWNMFYFVFSCKGLKTKPELGLERGQGLGFIWQRCSWQVRLSAHRKNQRGKEGRVEERADTDWNGYIYILDMARRLQTGENVGQTQGERKGKDSYRAGIQAIIHTSTFPKSFQSLNKKAINRFQDLVSSVEDELKVEEEKHRLSQVAVSQP